MHVAETYRGNTILMVFIICIMLYFDYFITIICKIKFFHIWDKHNNQYYTNVHQHNLFILEYGYMFQLDVSHLQAPIQFRYQMLCTLWDHHTVKKGIFALYCFSA